MSLLERIGLVQRKPRPVGQTLEKGRPEPSPSSRKSLLLKAGIFALLVVLTLAAFPRGDVFETTVQVGDEWRQETLRAPFDFPLYKSEEALAAEYESVRLRVPPRFAAVPGALGRVTANRDTLAQRLDRVLEVYASYQENRLRGQIQEAAADSLQYVQLRRSMTPRLGPRQWQLLADSSLASGPGGGTASGGASASALHRQLLDLAFDRIASLIARGVLSVPRSQIPGDEVIVQNTAEGVERTVSADELYGMDEAYAAAQQAFEQTYPDRPDVVALGALLAQAILEPSLQYQEALTEAAWERAESLILSTVGAVEEGEVIVERGERVTPEVRQKLVSLERKLNERRGPTIGGLELLGQLLVTLATYAFFFIYLFLLRRQVFDDNRQVFLVALLFSLIIALFAVAIRVEGAPVLAVPVAIASILITVMFDSRVGLFATITLAFVGANLLNYDYEFAFATVFAGAMGVYSVRDIKNRGQFFLSAGLVFLGYLTVLTASLLFLGTSSELFGRDVLLAAINGVLLLLAYPLLWAFERTFDVTTDLTLLELSDTNRPLLKDLATRAPGTFNHSLQVANLAEAAADAIGANALLTRVGALYHDVGKMLKPEYFVENQRPGQNAHDQLKPRMSALIIAAHVKEGLEMARQYKLPDRVLRFIPMHHGTMRIEYFYHKAQEQRGPDEPPVQESEFRYPGPRPDSKETGILMLADSVEAASRSLSEPTHKRLETLIEMIFRARIDDGQLDATDLTFRDLSLIRETFLSMLLGIYHVRVKYPGGGEGGKRAPDQKRPTDEPPPAHPPQPPQQPAETAAAANGDVSEANDQDDLDMDVGRRASGDGAPEQPPAEAEARPPIDGSGDDRSGPGDEPPKV